MAFEGVKNVGILAMEIYFPKAYVCQEKLEVYDQVSAGKYTIGLGQEKMGFCNDREDIHSICLTVVASLMAKYDIAYGSIGRLEVGTETLLDKSKSVKSHLMELFTWHGNAYIEGIDCKNACYGGTAALFQSIDWIESSAWDGRLALVVAADIAVYSKGPARPTGGAGAVAMLIGPNAPMVLESPLRATFMSHTYDFYKSDLASPYPIVDGQLSVASYMSALDACYLRYIEKAQSRGECLSLDAFDYVLFHAPYGKLVQKSFSRLLLLDYVHGRTKAHLADLEKYKNMDISGTFFDKEMDALSMDASKALFQHKTLPSLSCSRQIGNMYCGSLYAGLVSLLCSSHSDHLVGKRLAFFSFGSGLAASFFSFQVVASVGHIAAAVSLHERLGARTEKSPEEFDRIMDLCEQKHGRTGYVPESPLSDMFPLTYYLEKIDEKYKRYYKKHLLTSASK